MKLLSEDIRKILPKLYEQDGKGNDAIVYVKFFDPCSQWTWYVTEFDGTDIFFGLVLGHEIEWGYFSLKELSECRNSLGLGIERDLHFHSITVGELKSQIKELNHNDFVG